MGDKLSGALLMIDLCSGLGGASAAMIDRGWRVVRVDNDPSTMPDIVADVHDWCWDGPRPDLIWASPPCVEFSRTLLPWVRNASDPDLSLVLACRDIIEDAQPRYWVIENVRGARKWLRPHLGEAREHAGPYWFWGRFPLLALGHSGWAQKQRLSSRARLERAKIPYVISRALAIAVESQLELIDA